MLPSMMLRFHAATPRSCARPMDIMYKTWPVVMAARSTMMHCSHPDSSNMVTLFALAVCSLSIFPLCKKTPVSQYPRQPRLPRQHALSTVILLHCAYQAGRRMDKSYHSTEVFSSGRFAKIGLP